MKVGTEIEYKRVYARNIVRTATLENIAVMLSFGCLCDKKKYTEYAELTRVVTDSHHKTISVMMMTMMIASWDYNLMQQKSKLISST